MGLPKFLVAREMDVGLLPKTWCVVSTQSDGTSTVAEDGFESEEAANDRVRELDHARPTPEDAVAAATTAAVEIEILAKDEDWEAVAGREAALYVYLLGLARDGVDISKAAGLACELASIDRPRW